MHVSCHTSCVAKDKNFDDFVALKLLTRMKVQKLPSHQMYQGKYVSAFGNHFFSVVHLHRYIKPQCEYYDDSGPSVTRNSWKYIFKKPMTSHRETPFGYLYTLCRKYMGNLLRVSCLPHTHKYHKSKQWHTPPCFQQKGRNLQNNVK